MARNAEVKARLFDRPRTEAMVVSIATRGPVTLIQEDIFFSVPTGRLKLRTIDGASGELIYYLRPDVSGPKLSRYERVPVENATALSALLGPALGVRGRVGKVRTLYLVGRTRVHLDQVDTLGDFIELEVVLQEGDSVESAFGEAAQLLARIGVEDTELESRAYIDLLT
jgi:predicted adenylyl cyclase CyaB